MKKAFCFALSILVFSHCSWLPCQASTVEIFSLGTKDQSFKEFSPPWRVNKPVVFRVGKNSPDRDWPTYQPGSLDRLVTRSTMQKDWVDSLPGDVVEGLPNETSQIVFNLPKKPEGSYFFRLDAIFRYRRPATPRLVLTINGRAAGSYQLSPRPAPELWWPNGGEGEGNLQYFGYEAVKITIPASVFTSGENTMQLRFVDGFGIYYDHLSLENDSRAVPPLITDASVQPTILFKQKGRDLVELAKIHLRTTQALGKVQLNYAVGGFRGTVDADQQEAGDIDAVVEVPARGEAQTATLSVSSASNFSYKGSFVPCRRWKVYALPMEQADFGYNDLPARTLEWENRFIDRALEIQHQFPSYSFTLDAAANLESYMATRDTDHGEQVLQHLRSGKWGINALYANFFTGLASPEELFYMLRYSQQASRRYGFALDSASQTDEPSVTWALPQVLASAGIKYFSNGSDPIRGALNPVGLLNFRSPFYWESANGSKILTWSAVSYTALDDMTWAGWSEAGARTQTYVPSIYGLQHSLPLFLSQYERTDFPFDAVFLFGLHNDEIPMRHWGDADVLQAWNQEYAYPKIIAAPQRDFFAYITTNFESKIQTVRGDGGAYWEDEAGADARTEAAIRAAQTQLLAAEKFESLAQWLKPGLNFDQSAFDQAWTNILLADSYVWSDANSFRRPMSERTLLGEAAHRAWANAASQQSGDLRLKAADKIAELIETKDQGFAILNSENWERSGLFDAELEPDEALLDPSTHQEIPCASLQWLDGYQKVRCWAHGVPALGYRFYSIGKGRVSKGEPLTLDQETPAIENTNYRLVLDPSTARIVHLVDKETGFDLVDESAGYGLNEYLYITGGDPGDFLPGSLKDNRILAADVTLPFPHLKIERALKKNSPVARRFPWGSEITIRYSALNTPDVTTTITLLDYSKQILIRNDVEKIATLKKESVYFAFPFSLSRPTVAYEGATAWVNPEKDMLPGANLQWFATQGGVWATTEGNSVAWTAVDAPLITFGDINRGLWPTSIEIKSGTLFSYAMNNYWYTDTPAQQGGSFTFRYALTSGPQVSSENAVTLSSEARSPLVVTRRYSMGWPATQPPRGRGFLETNSKGVKVLTIRPSSGHNEFLVRVQNASRYSVRATLHISGTQLSDAFAGSATGEKAADIDWTPDTVTLPLKGYDIQTVVLRIRPTH